MNQFRDEAYFDPNDRLYAIDSKSLSAKDSLETVPYRWQGDGYNESAYQLAVTENKGFLATCSFYGDTIMIFPIDLHKGIDDQSDPAIIQ